MVTYMVSVYGPMWFEIKVKSSWLEGPRHVLTHLSLLRLQSPEVRRAFSFPTYGLLLGMLTARRSYRLCSVARTVKREPFQ